MSSDSVGFIGGGRVVRILLGGLRQAGESPTTCVISDTAPGVLDDLQKTFPEVRTVGHDIAEAAGQDLVFGALHPPAMKEALPRIGASLHPGSVFVSLAPVIRLPALQAALGGFERVARMIPNAASIVGSGFNPIAFSDGLAGRDKQRLLERLAPLGESPEVPDHDLEAYAILTAMGPTYLWYQFEALERLGVEFGLDPGTTRRALFRMVHGAATTFFESGLTAEEVIDLVPVKPLQEAEDGVREAYGTRLRGLHAKLTGG